MCFCVNCGERYERAEPVCPSCWLDQQIPEASLRAALSSASGRVGERPRIGFPGEWLALYLAIAATAAVLLALGVLSIGIVPALAAASLFSVYTHLLSAQRNFVAISATNLAKYERLALLAAHRVGVRPPHLFVRNDPSANAYAIGVGSGRCVVVNSSLLGAFAPGELLFVLGHEMGHLSQGHTAWLMLLEPARVGGSRFLFASVLGLAFNVWSVKAEHTADQAGLIACRDLEVAISALVRISSGVSLEPGAVSAPEMSSAHATVARLLEYRGTHPSVVSRIENLRAFAASPAIGRYLARNATGEV